MPDWMDDGSDVPKPKDTERDLLAKIASVLAGGGGSGGGGVTGVFQVDTYAALRAQAIGPNPVMAATRGKNAKDDGGQAIFLYDAAETDADDDDQIIKPTAVGGAGRWVRYFP